VCISISGGEFIFCGCVSSTALVQGFRLGPPHVSHGRLHAGGSLGRDHHMRSGRYAVVPGARSSERHSLADTCLPIPAAGPQP